MPLERQVIWTANPFPASYADSSNYLDTTRGSSMKSPQSNDKYVRDNIAVFRTYSREEFIKWSPWQALDRILNTNGGAYGFSGPRGSGKTWLMRHAVSRAQSEGGVGLWFPSPSSYQAEAFVSALADAFADAIQRRYDWDGVRCQSRLKRFASSGHEV